MQPTKSPFVNESISFLPNSSNSPALGLSDTSSNLAINFPGQLGSNSVSSPSPISLISPSISSIEVAFTSSFNTSFTDSISSPTKPRALFTISVVFSFISN